MDATEQQILDTIDEQVAKRAAEGRQRRLSVIGERALRWLALVPEWTDSLAQACEFPVEQDGLDAMLERATRARLCETRREPLLSGEEVTRFWMPTTTRTELLRGWQVAAGRDLRADAADIARRILAARAHGQPVTEGVERWAELAKSELAGESATGDYLSEAVSESLRRADTGGALKWIFAGEALAPPLGAEMARAAARAKRRLNLHYRRSHDRRHLRGFLERAEHMEVLGRIARDEDVWAAHFIGVGGSGKTMLMRYLTSASPAFPSVGRVDFDHIDPRYPLERPARLLQALAEDLALTIEDSTQEALLRTFFECVTVADAAAGSAPPAPDPCAVLDAPELEAVIAGFSRFVEALPAPVLLILDTCEELAKLHPAEENVPSIDATFGILEAVHERAPGIRVVFAGRRPLTREGANWSIPSVHPPSVMSLRSRPYLHVHEVRGFTREEVGSYLRELRGLTPSPGLFEAILSGAPETGRVPAMIAPGDAVDGDQANRYNPADVALYGDWLEDDPGLAPDQLSDDGLDAYVEARIIDRLAPNVLGALPFATLLGRFDAATVLPALDGSPAERRQALISLSEEELVRLEGGPELESLVFEVEPRLRSRLLRYYEDPAHREVVAEARGRLVAHLGRALHDSALESLSAELVDAAVTLLPDRDAALGLDALAARVERDAAWRWAEEVCGRLLAEDRDDPLPVPLRATVRALYIAGYRHRRPSSDVRSLWKAVVADAPAHPDPHTARALAARGRLGHLAAAAVHGGLGEEDAARALQEADFEDAPTGVRAVAPAVLTVIEALVDREEAASKWSGELPLGIVASCLDRLRKAQLEPVFAAYACALQGRLLSLAGLLGQARQMFERTEDFDVPPGETPQLYADWVAPASVRHRMLLDRLRFRLAERSETDDLLEWCEQAALDHLPLIDASQLLSLVLQARLARAFVPAATLAGLERRASVLPGHHPTAPAHHVAPPLFVSIADAWLAIGQADRALTLLGERERLATSRRTDEAGARAAVLATVRTIRRLRLEQRLGLIAELSTDEDPEVRAEAVTAAALVLGVGPPVGPGGRQDHAAWQATSLLDAARDDEALDRRDRDKLVSRDFTSTLHVALDDVEAQLVSRRFAVRRQAGESDAAREVSALLESSTESIAATSDIRDPLDEGQTRLALRLYALGIRPEPSSATIRYRERLVGRIALDEGELLALRLPDRAVKLLSLAQRLCAGTGDSLGAFIASLRVAIAEIHAGAEMQARDRRNQVVRRYETARSMLGEDLPQVWDLTDIRFSLGAAESDPLWGGWLRRLRQYLLWCDGEEVEGLSPFVPELHLVPATGVAAGTSHRLLKRAGTLLTAVETAGVAMIVSAGVTLLGWAIVDSLIVGLVFWLTLVVSAVVVGRFIAVPGLLRITEVDVTITSVFQEPDGKPEAEVGLVPLSDIRVLNFYARALGRLGVGRNVANLPIDDDDPLTEPLPSSIAGVARRRMGGHFPDLRLSVTSDLAPIPWEARLTQLEATRPTWSPERSPRAWRVAPYGRPAGRTLGWKEPAAAVCSLEWFGFVDRAWSGMPDRVFWAQSGANTPPAIPPASKALLLLGTPVYTSAGWRMRLDDDQLLAGESRPEDVDRQMLVSPDRLAPGAPLVVVIGQPGGERIVVNRQVADGLRGVGNEAFAAGAHAVITVPGLPAMITSDVLRLLAEEIDRWPSPPDLEALLGLVAGMQTAVYRSQVGAQDKERRLERVQATLDICLFADG